MSLINFFANVLHLISKKSWIRFTCTMANSNLLKDTYSLMTRVKWGVLVLETTHARNPLVRACSNSYYFLEVVKLK